MAETITAGCALPRDTLVVRGPDRRTWLDGLLTCAVGEVLPGVAAYGLLLTKQGKIVSDVFLADSGAELFLGVPPGLGAAVQQVLERYLVMEDAELTTPTTPLGWQLAPQPPAAPLEPAALASGCLKLGDLVATLQVAPARKGQDQAAVGALLAQHGLGSFGVDFGERDNPHEASLDRIAVSWTKGCYLGQEVVCMQDMRGKVKRRLVPLDGGAGLLGLQVAGGSEGPSVIGRDGAVIGHVTSVHPSPDGAARVLARLSTSALDSPGELSVQGTPVRVVGGSETRLS